MSKRTIFTNITPLPSQVTRQIVIDMLHDHDGMIELNPLVIEHHPIPPPKDAPAEEFAKCVWQSLTDKVQYLPGGLISGKVSYNASFYDLPYGLQTHIYAPLGLDIKGKWTVGGSMPGEPRVQEELGIKVPREGLYLREDCDMKCNILMTGFVKKTLQKAHSVLVDRLFARSEYVEDVVHQQRMSMQTGMSVPIQQYPRKPGTYSSSGSYASVSPQTAQDEWKRPGSLNAQDDWKRPGSQTTQDPWNRTGSLALQTSQTSELPHQQPNEVHEIGQSMTPVELESDPGYNNPAVTRYQTQRKANPFT